jgi:hypothetical protein
LKIYFLFILVSAAAGAGQWADWPHCHLDNAAGDGHVLLE